MIINIYQHFRKTICKTLRNLIEINKYNQVKQNDKKVVNYVKLS